MATQNKKYLDDHGLSTVANYVKERLKTVSTMPVSAGNGAVLLYTGATSSSYINGHIYQYNTSTNTWVDISKEFFLEQTVTTTTGNTFSFTFTDSRLVPGVTIDIYAGQLSQTGTQTVYDYSSVSLSSGSCTISYPAAPSNASVTCRIYIK